MKTIKKEFTASSWLECIYKIRIFIIDFNLELVRLELRKENNVFIAEVEYGLGVGR